MKRLALLLAVLGPVSASAQAPFPAGRVETKDGLVRMATDVRSGKLPGTVEQAAKGFARAHATALGLSPRQELGAAQVRRTRLGAVVRLPATFQGLPIIGQTVVVALDLQNQVRRVTSSAEPILDSVMSRRIDGLQAVARAADRVPGVVLRDGRPAGAFREVVYVRSGVARLAYEVHWESLNPLENWYAVVDAETGEVLSRTNRVFFNDAGIPDAGAPAADAGQASDAGVSCPVDAGASTNAAKVWLPSPGASSSNPLTEVTLPHLPEKGHLAGELIDVVTCCPNKDCNKSNPPLTVTGTASYGGLNIPFQTVFCDVRPRASNVASCRHDYDYSSPLPLSYDPPKATPGAGEVGDMDEFAEVHAYYHTSLAYDYFREVGDPAFVLRDSDPDRTSPPKKPQVWTNVVLPDVSAAQLGFMGVTINSFMRMDNSAFMPKEEWSSILMGASMPTPSTDTLLMFQGSSADFAYDGTVVYHEFTHGVVFSTANFYGPHLDAWGSLDEGMTLHEGFADLFAGAVSGKPVMAEWIGAKMPATPGSDGIARSLDNNLSCPNDVIGEPHHDGMIFSGATWALRKRHLGSDGGRTFDGAIFDALISMTFDAGIEQVAQAIADSLGTAFGSAAHDDAIAEFTARGVIGCQKAVAYAGPRARFFMNGTDSGYQPYAPGPVQLKLSAPQGAQAITVTATYNPAAHQTLGFGPPSLPDLTALVNVNKPVTFSGQTNNITDDAALRFALTVDGAKSLVKAKTTLAAVPGDTVYLALASKFAAQEILTNVTVELEPLPGVDAGMPPDAATIPPDAATEPVITVDAGAPSEASKSEGCGCSAGAAPSLLALGALAALIARRKSRARG